MGELASLNMKTEPGLNPSQTQAATAASLMSPFHPALMNPQLQAALLQQQQTLMQQQLLQASVSHPPAPQRKRENTTPD